MSQINEENQTDKVQVSNPERDQIIKMFCNDIKEINSQNEVKKCKLTLVWMDSFISNNNSR